MNISLQIDTYTRLLESLHALQHRLLIEKDSPKKSLHQLLKLLLEFTGSEKGLIGQCIKNNNKDQIRIIAQLDAEKIITPADAFFLTDNNTSWIYSLLHQASHSNSPLIINNCTENLFSEKKSAKNSTKNLPALNFIALPVYLENTLCGVLGLQRADNPYTEEFVKVLQPALLTVAVCISKMHHEESKNSKPDDNYANNLFGLLIQNSSDIITVLNEDATIRYESPSFYRITGFKQEEVEGRNVFDFVHPHDVQHVLDVFQQCVMQPGIGPPVEFRFLTANGSYIFLEAVGNNVLNQAEIKGVVVNSRDVTERKKIEEDLSFSQSHVQALLDAAPKSYFLLDENYQILKFNAIAKKYIQFVWNKQVEEGQNMLDYTNPADIEAFKRNFARAFTGERIVHERHIRYPNDIEIWFEIQYLPVYNTQGKIYGVSFTGLDISTRKKNENELKKLSLVARHTDNVVIITSKDGVTEWVNDGFTRITGFTFEEAIGKKPGELLQGPLTDPEKIKYMGQCVAAGKGFKEEIINYHKNGTPYWLSILVTPVFDQQGNLSNFIAIESDITARKQLEKKLLLTQHSVQNASEGIIWVNKEGYITEANKAFCNMLGCSEEEVSRLTIPDINPHFTNELWHQHWQELKEKKCITLEALQHSKNGKILPVEVNANYLTIDAFEYNVAFVRNITERKKQENATKQHLATLHAIQESTCNIIFALDSAYNYLSFNTMHAILMKKAYGTAICLGMNALEIFKTGQDWEKKKMYLDRALAGEQFTVERALHAADSETMYEVSYHPIHLEGNQVEGVAVFAHNITHKIASEKKLKSAFSQLKNYKSALDTSALVSITDLKGSIQYVNRNFCEVSKYSQRELLGQNHNIINSGYHPKSFFTHLWQTIGSGKAWRGEIKNRAKDGSYYWVDTIINPIYDEQGKLMQYLSIRYETTNRKKAEEKIKESEHFLKDAQQVARIGNWEVYLQTQKIIWSDEVFRIHHLDKKEGAPTTEQLLSLYHEEDAQLLKQAAAEAVEIGKAYTMDLRVLMPDGNVKYVNVIGKPVYNNAGKIERLRGTVMDINERKLNEIKLQQQNNELMKINEEMDRFVYSVSHNLRAPLTSVLGLINIFHLTDDKAAHEAYLAMMEKSIRKLDATIHEINNYSKNARLDLQTENIDLQLLFRDVIDDLAFIPEAKNIDILMEIPDYISLCSDKSRLKVIFINLLSNAIKYHDLQKEHPYIKVTACAEKKSVAVFIEDNGSGIAAENKDKIFNMFYRGSERSGGSGLGLYIVKESVHKLQGTIQVASEQGQGTVFTLVIPSHYSN